MHDDRKAHWEKSYGKGERSVSWYQQSPEPSLGLILEHREAAARGVIDIGAGASVLADRLFESGLNDITLLDISQGALEISRKRLSAKRFTADYLTTDITNWTPGRQWGIWHDRAVFHFLVSDRDRSAYLGSMAKATSSGSIIVIGTFALDGPEKCSGLPVQRYSVVTLTECLGTSYARIKSVDHLHTTPAARQQRFQFSVFRRL